VADIDEPLTLEQRILGALHGWPNAPWLVLPGPVDLAGPLAAYLAKELAPEPPSAPETAETTPAGVTGADDRSGDLMERVRHAAAHGNFDALHRALFDELINLAGEVSADVADADYPLSMEADENRRRIWSVSDPVAAFDAFIETWVAPRWHAHLLDNDTNDAEYVRTVIRGSQQ